MRPLGYRKASYSCLIFIPSQSVGFSYFENHAWKARQKSQCSADAQSYCFLIQFSRPWNSSNNGTYIPQFSARLYKHYQFTTDPGNETTLKSHFRWWGKVHMRMVRWSGAYTSFEPISFWVKHFFFFKFCCKVSLRLETRAQYEGGWSPLSPLAVETVISTNSQVALGHK